MEKLENEFIISALIRYGNIDETAKQTGVSKNLIWQCLQKAAFKENYAATAIDTARQIMQDANNSADIRLQAAELIIHATGTPAGIQMVTR